MSWQKEKPEKPCVFVTRYDIGGIYYEYDVWILKYFDDGNGSYLSICDGDGEEWGDWQDFKSQEYFIIEYLEEK